MQDSAWVGGGTIQEKIKETQLVEPLGTRTGRERKRINKSVNCVLDGKCAEESMRAPKKISSLGIRLLVIPLRRRINFRVCAWIWRERAVK